MAIIDQQGATIGRSQMGPVAAAAAATATVAAGGQQQQQRQQQQKRLSAQSRTAFGAAILCLMLPQTGCNSPPTPHPPLPSARRVAALVGHYGECRLRCLLLTDSSADVLLPLCKGGRPRPTMPLPLPLPLAASFAWLSLQRLNIYVLCT